MTQSRRDFLKSCGVLIVSFSAGSFNVLSAQAPGPFSTHSSHIDPEKLDSWLAVGADGVITAYTGKCDFGQGMFTAQCQLVAEELAADTAVIELQVPAVVVSVPDAGAQQDDIPAGKLLPTGQRVVNALAAGRKNNLHEAVRVQRVALLVKVIAGVGERAVREVEQLPAGVHRQVGHRRILPLRPGQS